MMRKFPRGSASLLVLLLGACGGGGGGNLPLNAFNTPPDNPANGGSAQTPASDGATPAPASGGQITVDNALALAAASTDVLVKLLGVGQLVASMVEDGASFIARQRYNQSAAVTACTNAGTGPGAFNQVTLQKFESGHFLPPGDNLHGTFDNCEFGGGVASGFVDVSALQVSGDPSVPGSDWTVSGLMTLDGLGFHNGDGTSLQFTNSLHYTLRQQGGSLITILDVETMNAEQTVDPQTRINYLLQPFYVRAVTDAAANRFTVTVGPGPGRGASVINRYTSRPAGTNAQGMTIWRSIGDDLELVIDSTAQPPAWAVAHPRFYVDAPVSGEILLREPAGGGSIRAVVDSSGGASVVDLSVDTGGAVITLRAAWQDLLTQP